jgi:hypothetical protein
MTSLYITHGDHIIEAAHYIYLETRNQKLSIHATYNVLHMQIWEAIQSMKMTMSASQISSLFFFFLSAHFFTTSFTAYH